MTAPTIDRPEPSEYPDSFRTYVALVEGSDVMDVLRSQPSTVRRTLEGLTPDQASHRYAEGKWSVRQVLGHVIDAERVFGFRALWFARRAPTSLPSFDENAWAEEAGSDLRRLRDMITEFEHLRLGHLEMFAHLPEDAWIRTGTASNRSISVRALAFVMAGHVAHHLALLCDRYGIPTRAAAR
jgi:uncharacterized damage-inducible protein DinB